MGTIGDAVSSTMVHTIGQITDAVADGIFEPVLNLLYQFLTATIHLGGF